ncbi:MAG: hypothetical protein PHX62_04895 [Bacilli bacterium]|nr:hypothetical protein [Bacilli bacterium]
MTEFTQYEIDNALKEIESMDHFTMCKLWRFSGTTSPIYFRSDLPTGKRFKERLFDEFGGFTPKISKQLGWNK